MSGLVAGPPRRVVVLDAVPERVTFVSADTGYTVARVATDRTGPDLLTVVGPLLGAQVGESLRLTGQWGNLVAQFSIRVTQVVTVDAHTDLRSRTADRLRDGLAVRLPTPMPGWETRSGAKVLIEEYRVNTMTSVRISTEDPNIRQAPHTIRGTGGGEPPRRSLGHLPTGPLQRLPRGAPTSQRLTPAGCTGTTHKEAQ